jgi:thioredoxin 1
MRDASRLPTGLICILAVMFISVLACGGSDEAETSSCPDDSEILDGVPSLIDLGSHSCVPCQMMVEELASLDRMTAEHLTVTFFDIYENRNAASQYGVRVIPTQVFLAPDGTELFRHEGFMSAEQMLAKWIELGYDVYESGDNPDAP